MGLLDDKERKVTIIDGNGPVDEAIKVRSADTIVNSGKTIIADGSSHVPNAKNAGGTPHKSSSSDESSKQSGNAVTKQGSHSLDISRGKESEAPAKRTFQQDSEKSTGRTIIQSGSSAPPGSKNASAEVKSRLFFSDDSEDKERAKREAKEKEALKMAEREKAVKESELKRLAEERRLVEAKKLADREKMAGREKLAEEKKLAEREKAIRERKAREQALIDQAAKDFLSMGQSVNDPRFLPGNLKDAEIKPFIPKGSDRIYEVSSGTKMVVVDIKIYYGIFCYATLWFDLPVGRYRVPLAVAEVLSIRGDLGR